jgi:predicted NBD/HSP70 family sugar kinase
MVARKRTPKHILVIDVGGTHVKVRLDTRGAIRKFTSGPAMTPAVMLGQVRTLTRKLKFDAVSIGYPGVVVGGRIAADPHNLAAGWIGFDFARALGKPVKLINDAAMQAIGSYAGGRMLFMGLGTGLGVTLIFDGIVEPTELGHLPYKGGKSFEDFVGERGRKARGEKKWRKTALEIIRHLKAALDVDYVVLGGGNAKRLKTLPSGVRLGNNRNAFIGGVRLWHMADGVLRISPRRRGSGA